MTGLININAWKAKTAAQKKKIQSSATAYVQKKTREIVLEALKVSPQWSGNYALNWMIETTATGNISYSKEGKVDPWEALRPNERRMGDIRAITHNLTKYNEDYIKMLHWNSKIKLVNRAPVSELLEAGVVKLRPENILPSGLSVAAHLRVKYRFVK